MKDHLKELRETLQDAGCSDEDIKTAERIYISGDLKAMIRHLRKCKCALIEELHKSQRKVDCMDYLIRQTQKRTI